MTKALIELITNPRTVRTTVDAVKEVVSTHMPSIQHALTARTPIVRGNPSFTFTGSQPLDLTDVLTEPLITALEFKKPVTPSPFLLQHSLKGAPYNVMHQGHKVVQQPALITTQKRSYHSQSHQTKNDGGNGDNGGKDGSNQQHNTQWSWKNILIGTTWLAGSAAFLWFQIRHEIPSHVTGDLVENPVSLNDAECLIEHAEDFEHAGEKKNGRMPGAIVKKKDAPEFYVEKSMPNREASLNEVVVGELMHMLLGDRAPKMALKQTPLEDGKAEFTVLSQILGHGRQDREPGRDLEKLAKRYDVEDEFAQHPIRGMGVAAALDLLFGKAFDMKLQNYVAYRENSRDGKSYYYGHSIDHEFGFWGKATLELDPEAFISAIKDLNEEDMGEMISKITPEGDRPFGPDSKMPLRGTEKAYKMRKILSESIQKDMPYIAKIYKDFAELSPEAIQSIPKRLEGFITEKEAQKYVQDIANRQKQVQQFIESNKEQFTDLLQQHAKLEAQNLEAEQSFVEKFCSGQPVDNSLLPSNSWVQLSQRVDDGQSHSL